MAKTMIQQVAMALAAADNGAPTTWKLYAEDARVAINAMREANDAVRHSGEEMMDTYSPGTPVDLIWKSMIDAALAEPLAL